MNIWQRFIAGFGAPRDMLGFAAQATPTAEEWLATFTREVGRHPDVEYGARALLSGLRFYTADFVAALAALPPRETRRPAILDPIAQGIYTAAGPLIGAVYQTLIRHKAGATDIQAAFRAAAPGLFGHYDGAVYVTSGAHLRYAGPGQ